MKKIVALIPALSILFAAACGDADRFKIEGLAAEIYSGECAEKSDEIVTIYSGRKENLIDPVLQAFQCATGINVEVRWGKSAELAMLINEEGDQSPADVFLSQSPGPVSFLEAKGHLAALPQNVLNQVTPQNRSNADTWVGFSGRKRVLVYNIDAIDPSDLPTSVFDLTDEKWRGQIAVPATNGSFMDWFTVFRNYHGDDVATTWLQGMVDNDARYYPNNRSIVEAASRGEIKAGLVNHYYNYQESAVGGSKHRAENHDFDDSDIGSLLIITAATILDSTKNTSNAQALVEYLLSSSVQQYFTDQTLEYPLAADIAPNQVLPPLAALQIGSIDFDSLGSGLDKTSQIIESSGIQNQ